MASVLAAEPVRHLTISEVLVDNLGAPNDILMLGVDFLFGKSPVVTLGEFGELELLGPPTDGRIHVLLPEGIAAGDYRLKVSTGEGQSHNDSCDLTLGAVEPEGPPGADGAPGRDGSPGQQGPPGEDGLSEALVWSAFGLEEDRFPVPVGPFRPLPLIKHVALPAGSYFATVSELPASGRSIVQCWLSAGQATHRGAQRCIAGFFEAADVTTGEVRQEQPRVSPVN